MLAALQLVLDSPELDGAGRVQAFLSYIVHEALAGRGDSIRGKTIVEDVYGRSPQQGRDPMAVVRVDAGRLRRRLTEYYLGSGKDAKLRFHVKPGSYKPEFQFVQDDAAVDAPPDPTPDVARSLKPRVLTALIFGGLVIAALLWRIGFPADVPLDAGDTKQPIVSALTDSGSRAVREALFSTSPARLQAANLANLARDNLFPALEPGWLELVLEMFELTIGMDKNYFGGYAGAAQVEAILAMTLPQGPERDARIDRAAEFASAATDLGVGNSWSHSAAALVAMAQKDYDRALAQSARATTLAPDDADALCFDALIALYSGQFQRAIKSAELVGRNSGSTDHFPDQSIRAAAHFHLGEFENALSLLNNTVLEGEPISPISLAYLIASHVGLEDLDQAAELFGLLERAWPGYRFDALLHSLYQKPAHAEEILEALKAVGWVEPSIPAGNRD